MTNSCRRWGSPFGDLMFVDHEENQVWPKGIPCLSHHCASNLLWATALTTQRLQKPLIEEYTLNLVRVLVIFQGYSIFLNLGVLESLGMRV